ncbi:MAG: hypothetical protein I4N51_14415 [Acinetobacter sp.]|nr:hypothetical protein [Acinetobacter sp.]
MSEMWVGKGITQSFLQETLNSKMTAMERRNSVFSQVVGDVSREIWKDWEHDVEFIEGR